MDAGAIVILIYVIIVCTVAAVALVKRYMNDDYEPLKLKYCPDCNEALSVVTNTCVYPACVSYVNQYKWMKAHS
jgi:hypothetical protein